MDVISFAQKKATKCLQNENLIDKESASLLWNFIVLLCRQNGVRFSLAVSPGNPLGSGRKAELVAWGDGRFGPTPGSSGSLACLRQLRCQSCSLCLWLANVPSEETCSGSLPDWDWDVFSIVKPSILLPAPAGPCRPWWEPILQNSCYETTEQCGFLGSHPMRPT